MARVNEEFLNLKNDYLFSKIIEKTNEYKAKNTGIEVKSLGIGDVTLPLVKPVIEAMHKAVDEMSKKETFRGYGLVQGYDFLIEKIIKTEYEKIGVTLDHDEVFIAAGTKGDLAGMVELLSINNTVGLMDPVYPAYRDMNIMMGRDKIVYLKGTEENGFIPELPKEHVDIIYLCSPNNPTGIALNREQLTKWVNYARENHSIIFYDSVYEAFITNENMPHSIYEIEGAKEVAVEFRSYSKIAGFTGVRCSYTVVPKTLNAYTKDNEKISINSLWRRGQSTKFGAASYIVQRAAEAIYTEEGQKEIKENINYYKENAKYIKEELEKAGFKVYGGEDSPYIWLKVPDDMKSWEFFDKLLNEVAVVGTPGVGFGEQGEGFFRLTAFSSKEDTEIAVSRIVKLFK
ncbi:MAG: LL-diaminopimelate aminotransferase [Clostridia bacterium]|nr:LL-diaminopimelate aminotransferase [Clostridia bacterium]